MITDKLNEKTINMLRENLAGELIEKIDFDQVIEILGTIRNKINQEQETVNELEYLKEEYRSRIIGMVKANLACRKNQKDSDLAVKLADDISGISAEELVGMYARVAARFRTNFPASFRYLTMPSWHATNRENWKEHKI